MVKIKNIMQDREINRHKSLREFIQFANEKAKYLTSICLAGLILVLFQPNTLYAQSYSLSVDKLGTGSGTVTSSPAGIDCGSDCYEVYGATTVVTLTAAPDVGFVFAGWSGDCLGTGPCIVTMDSSKDITATFNPSIPSILSGDYHLVRDNYIGTYTFDGVGNVSFEYWTHPYDPAIYHYIAGTASYAVTTAWEVTVSNIHYTDGTPSTPADPAACFQYG